MPITRWLESVVKLSNRKVQGVKSWAFEFTKQLPNGDVNVVGCSLVNINQ